MSAKRLASGGRIDRETELRFTWDGRAMSGYPGDTLASALLANGEKVFGRSFKYHRPRGVMSCGVEESGAIVTIGEGARKDPNVKAPMQELYAGLIASGQNAWPNVRFDLGSVSNLMSRFFVAGFYYKTFMGLPPFEWSPEGTAIWMWYEKFIRRAAGMGEASRLPDPDTYEHAHAHCDVLVVGGGPAGMAAAIAATQAGLDVWLIEQDFELGGDLLSQSDQGAEKTRLDLVAGLRSQGVYVMLRTTAFGLYDNGVAGLVERVTDHLAHPGKYQPRQRMWTVRAKHTVVAAGAMERLVAFGNNDRPGVMSAAAARSYVNRFGVLAGQKVVVATNNDSAYQSAIDLAAAGAEVNLLDARAMVAPSMMEKIAAMDISLRTNSAPLKANGSSGVRSLEIARSSGTAWKAQGSEECDLVMVSGGWNPVINLISHRGDRPLWNVDNACFVASEQKDSVHMAGSAAGIWQTDDCIGSGQVVAARIGEAMGQSVTSLSMPAVGGWDAPIKPLYEVRIEDRKLKSFIDPQHDVSAEDVRLAHREGFVSVEHLKRYTTLGMATDGGKMGNIIGLALMAEALGKEIPEVGATTFRPPYTPVTIGALRGRSVDQHFRPLRRTPMHDWNLLHGSTMTIAGLWHRPWYFAKAGETISEAYVRETGVTRNAVGLCDVTSLGKIAIQGPDATEFLDRIYTNPFAKLPIGKARYGIMLRDDGMVMDDGTTWRMAEHDYFMTTTTAHAGKVMMWLEQLLQTRWQNLKVHVASVSEQWAGCAVAGPKSREVLDFCIEDPTVISNDTLPFMGVIETRLKGDIPCRIARISFSGEMAYEVYTPSDHANAMMEMLWNKAESVGGCLYGTEALGAMRIEKGHVTGAELDGRVTIEDAGLGKMASARKSFIGSALRNRPELMREDRPRLAGIKPVNNSETFNAGAILCQQEDVSGPGEGWITGATHSPSMGHWIGIGFVAGGHENWQGKTLIATDPVRKGNVEVEVISPHMYDPSGERMYG